MKKSVRVLQIIPSFGTGGAEKVVLNYLSYFKKNNNVKMLAVSLYGKLDGPNDEIIEKENLDVKYLNKNRGLDLSMMLKISKVINEFKPDVIHGHMYINKYLIPTLLFRRKIKLFHTIHNEPHKDARRIDKIFNKIAFNLFKSIPVALNNEHQIQVNKYYNSDSTIVIHNAINANNFLFDNKTRDAKRKELGLNDRFIIGHIGRFMSQKNHTFLIEVFNEIYKIEPTAVLYLVGDGILLHSIVQKTKMLSCRDNIIFAGIRSDIPDLFQAMDFFLFPSLHEGLPLTLIEAQAAGIKCLVSDTITKDVQITDLLDYESLNNTSFMWAKKVVAMKDYVRSDRYSEIVKAGYNIEHEMVKLGDMYNNIAF